MFFLTFPCTLILPAMEARPGYYCLQLKKQTSWLRTTQKAQARDQHTAFGLPGQCAVWSAAGFGESSESPENTYMHRPGTPGPRTPMGGHEFLEERLSTEVEKSWGWQRTLGPVHLWLSSLSTRLHTAPLGHTAHKLGDLTNQSWDSRMQQIWSARTSKPSKLLASQEQGSKSFSALPCCQGPLGV